MAELARSALSPGSGEEGARLHARARGEETEPFRPRRTPGAPGPAPADRAAVEELEPLRFVLHRLAGALTGQLAGARPGRGPGATCAWSWTSRSPAPGRRRELTVEQRFPEPTADAEAIERLLFARLERDPPPAAVARLDLELAGTAPAAGQQLPLFVPQAARDARLGWQLARLALTFGEDRVRRVALHRPRGAAARGALDVALGRSRRAGDRRMTRLLREHPAIEVETRCDGAARRHRWNGRREPVEVCNRWRVEEAWWRDPIARDYVKVVGERWLALVYLDRIDGTWHLERLYD